MKSAVTSAIGPMALAAMTGLALLAPVAPAAADPAWRFTLGSAPAGVVTTAGQLALDPSRGDFYITNNTFPVHHKTYRPTATIARVTVFSTAAQRAVRTIDMSSQPSGTFNYGPIPIPMGQYPDGIALDLGKRKVVTTNAHANGISVFSMDARSAGPQTHTDLPGSHPMGVATNNNGRAWVSLFYTNKLAVVDTGSGRIVGSIPTFHPTLLAYDSVRSRLYVGNNDHNGRKRNHVAVVDTRSGRVVKTIPTTRNSRPVLDPSTGRVIVASFISGRVASINPDTLAIEKTVDTKSTPSALALDPQRRLLYATTMFKKTLLVLDADSLRTVATMRVPDEIHTLALDPRSGWVYGTRNNSSQLLVIRPSRG